MAKKTVIEVIDWFMYRLLSTKQRESISGLFTQKQKDTLKRVIKPGKKRAQMKKIERLKFRLYNQGFTERGLNDLYDVYENGDDAYLQKLTAWELALWHANQYTEADAQKCLAVLPEAVRDEKDKGVLRRAAILEAESYAQLGKRNEGKEALVPAMARENHADLFLASANLETSVAERMVWINHALELHQLLPVSIDQSTGRPPYDTLVTETQKVDSSAEAPKVSVIIPAFNAEDVIETSLGSILAQTWRNLEVLVADDCSKDNTANIVEEYAKHDERVRLLSTKENSGAYVARNMALQVASGDYITINDADDWSHPQKIETQVKHLEKHEKLMGNTSQQARTSEQLTFSRRGKPGLYIFSNMSSFMFRRKAVMKAIGFWDSVRFGGDSEFIKRLKNAFGEKAIAEVPTGPLSFQRQTETSLTGHSAFGFPGFFMGARAEYAEAHEHHHEQATSLYYDFPQKRPFPVPEPMWPQREEKPSGRRHFDVVIVSEFRLLGGTNMSNIEELKAQKQLGLRTGLIQMSRYDLNSVDRVNPKVRELIDGDQVHMLVYGEKISCDVLIVRHPPILQEWQRYIPDVEAKRLHVIVNQPPKKEYSTDGERLYEIGRCVNHLQAYFGQTGTWHPIGPQIRDSLHEHHAEELTAINLSDEDWVNIINVEEWRRSTRPDRHSTIRIGRHSRPQYVKWPADREELLTIYPNADDYEIHVLGGADTPRKILNGLPSNWYVHEFGDVEPKDFLAKLDVFVYYTHPDWVEAFGRVIFEAMAVGVPVIIPPNYKGLFGDAAIYAEPAEVQEKIQALMNDEAFYKAQVNKAQAYVEAHFGYSKHASRLGGVLVEQ